MATTSIFRSCTDETKFQNQHKFLLMSQKFPEDVAMVICSYLHEVTIEEKETFLSLREKLEKMRRGEYRYRMCMNINLYTVDMLQLLHLYEIKIEPKGVHESLIFASRNRLMDILNWWKLHVDEFPTVRSLLCNSCNFSPKTRLPDKSISAKNIHPPPAFSRAIFHAPY